MKQEADVKHFMALGPWKCSRYSLKTKTMNDDRAKVDNTNQTVREYYHVFGNVLEHLG